MDRVEIERHSVGIIDIPDDRVCVCNPLLPMDTTPLAQRLKPGKYEAVPFVPVGREHDADTKTEYNAAAALIYSRENPEHWELAAREGGPPDAAANGVNSGTGGSMGGSAIALLLGEVDALNGSLIRGSTRLPPADRGPDSSL